MIEIPPQTGRHVVITGANTGIGRVTAVKLAAAGARVTLAGRSADRTQPVVEQICAAGGTANFVPLDLGEFASVRAAAAQISDSGPPVHTLINNAGLAGHRGETKDGFEIQFGVNHLGPFLFTNLLLPMLRGAEDARIVNVASRAHTRVNAFDWQNLRGPTVTKTGFVEYCNSKLANVLFSAELARREEVHRVRVYSLHPGVVATDIWRNLPGPLEMLAKLFMISVEEGAETTLHCAASAEAGQQTGLYYDRCKPKKTSETAQEEALSRELWARSAEWTGLE